MEVRVLSETKQEFNGVAYYRSGHYFQRDGVHLHIAVWQYHNGEIPPGHHVHHRDGDRSNNQIENLQALPAFEHISAHSRSRVEYNLRHMEEMRSLAFEWHGTEQGRAWHSEHAKRYWSGREPISYTCPQCGKSFESMRVYGPHDNRFCCNYCKAKFRRASGVDNEQRTCALCGNAFTANRYEKNRFCSRSCAVDARRKKA